MARYLNECRSCGCPFYGDWRGKECSDCAPYLHLEKHQWGEREPAETYTYVIRCGDSNYYKIGLAEKPHVRLGGLQTGCPYKLSLTMSRWAINRERAEFIEKGLHKMFQDCRILSEWFELTQIELNLIGQVFDETRNMSTKELRKWFYGLSD